MKRFLYRNIQAGGRLQALLLSAVASLLLVRLYLHLTGYPQVGGEVLHIAHVLWGGLLMLVALVLLLSFIGKRVQMSAAIVGGAGFGVFIDELGKFITKDNNYFYEPTIGIIYAIFVVLYLIFNFLGQKRVLSSREYQMNALTQLEEAVASDMDPREKARMRELLQRADQEDQLTQQLTSLLNKADIISVPQPNMLTRMLKNIDDVYARFWRQRGSSRLVQLFFIFEILLLLGAVVFSVGPSIANLSGLFGGDLENSVWLAAGEISSLIVATGFILWGVFVLPVSRLRALEQFRRATLINIFLTNFFMFTRVEFEALPSFFFNLVLLGLISYAFHYEQRHAKPAK